MVRDIRFCLLDVIWSLLARSPVGRQCRRFLLWFSLGKFGFDLLNLLRKGCSGKRLKEIALVLVVRRCLENFVVEVESQKEEKN